MDRNKYKINISGSEYIIATEEEESYVNRLADTLDGDIRKLTDGDSFVSVTTAAVLTALNYLDESIKSKDNVENLRSQMKTYLEESAQARIEADNLRRELEELKNTFGL